MYHLQEWNLVFWKRKFILKLVLPSISTISLKTQIWPAVHPACVNLVLNFQLKVDLELPIFKLFSWEIRFVGMLQQAVHRDGHRNPV